MEKTRLRAISLFLTILVLSACLCLPVGAVDGELPSQAYTELAEKIAYAEQNVMTKPEGYWHEGSYSAFLESYEQAKEVLAEPTSTDDDYRYASEWIQMNLDQLRPQSYFDLADVVQHAADILYIPGGPEWSDESRTRLSNQYEYAKGVLDNQDSTDQDYIDAKEKLEYAIEHLEPFNDKTALWDLIKWVRSSGLLDSPEKYTAGTYQAFLEAYNNASMLEMPTGIPQEKLDEAVEQLNIAIDGLWLMGDVNNDKEITIMDVLEIQKHLAGVIILPPDALEAADTDRSGGMGVNDCLMIQKYIAKMIEDFTA